jgi:hypothetical protein
MSAEDLAKEAAERVREIVAEAERRAEQILRDAETDAAEIRQRADREAREKFENVRNAIADLAAETPEPPVPGPDPTPPTPDPVPPTPAPEPGPPGAPEPGPQLGGGNSSGGGDAAPRLVAMKLAVDGKGPEEIAYELDTKFGVEDRAALIDEVLARAGK